MAKAEARTLYDDLTPAPTAAEIEMRRMERLFRATMTAPGAPDKRQQAPDEHRYDVRSG